VYLNIVLMTYMVKYVMQVLPCSHGEGLLQGTMDLKDFLLPLGSPFCFLPLSKLLVPSKSSDRVYFIVTN
jgi:hypothetical protein